jgi:beta-glucosidase
VLITAQTRRRAAELVAALSVADRIRLVSGRDLWTTEAIGPVPSVRVADGPNGLRREAEPTGRGGLAGPVPATCFPVAAALAASWDPALVQEVGAAIGAEARANGVALLLAPGLNLKRHPCGGRNFEYFAEDPLLAGRLAAAFVRGVQSTGVGACVKHFAVNNQESGRMVLDAVLDERTLRELYLRGFEIAVAEGRPAAVMTAYNQVNGVHCSEHPELLGILRREWGFDGLTVSDWVGTNDRVASLAAGLDLEMPGGASAFDAEVARAVGTGRLPRHHLDAAAARVAAFALAGAQALAQAGPAEPGQQDRHHRLARRAAAAGTVLLVNNGLLPLPPGLPRLAVIGAFAEHPRFQGAGSSKVAPTRVDTLLDALREDFPLLRYERGYDPRTGRAGTARIADAAAAARQADAVVLVLGLPPGAESEAADRPDLRLPADLDALARAVLAANPRTAVVLQHGSALELPWADDAAALVAGWLGGQAAGAALADVLLGRAEPGGRLAESFPGRLADLPASANFPGGGRQVQHRERWRVGYRAHDAGAPARFPFGAGLSYTTFAFGPAQVSGAGTSWEVSVPVTNTGERPGSTVLQVYLSRPASARDRPAKELVGFARVALPPGASAPAVVALDRRSFACWDTCAGSWLVEAGPAVLALGTSSTDLFAAVELHIPSADTLSPVPACPDPLADDAAFAALLGRPAPAPRPTTPFSRSTTLPELAATRRGRLVARVLRAAARRQAGRSGDPEQDAMLDAFVAGMPLRGFVQAGDGRVPMRALDGLLRLLNAAPHGVRRPPPR